MSQTQPAPTGKSPSLVLVTGGRDYTDHAAVWRVLDRLLADKPNLTIIHGACATGADALAEEWAKARQRPYIGVPAEWDALGKAAGPIRNGRMLHYLPTGVVAFPGGDGTQDMCEQAEAAGVTVWRAVRA